MNESSYALMNFLQLFHRKYINNLEIFLNLFCTF